MHLGEISVLGDSNEMAPPVAL